MRVKNLMGSLAKDLFKWWHKQIPGAKRWYGCDIDFSLLDRNGILCLQDYKNRNDSITWAEVKTYKDLSMRGLPLYIVKGNMVLPNDIIMFSKKNLTENLRGLGIPTPVVETIMETNIEKTLKARTMNTMSKDLSVWNYTPDNSKKGYSSKFVSDNYIEWEARLRERKNNV
jgi:exonuclease III